MRLYFSTICFLCCFTSCFEHKTTDPKKAYTLWLDQEPDSGVTPLKAHYWQSAHWTKEYILYMEMTVSKKWWEEVKKGNGFIRADWKKWSWPTDTPTWFKPPKRYEMWRFPDEYQWSRYFKDSLSDTLYIYEIQL
jgi:hypothetical protein